MHAVSVGEVISAAGLLRDLRARSKTTPLFVSVTTVAGRAVAEEKLSRVADGIFYAPIDYVFAVRRVLLRLRPTAVVILETEIWPVLYREVKRSGASLVIVNGRISDRALPRYMRARHVLRHVLRLPDAIFTQTEPDRMRFVQLGAPARIVQTLGNLKYDAAPIRDQPPRVIHELIERLRPNTVWIAASTMPPTDAADIDEDEAVLSAFQDLAVQHPDLLLILVPRKPERFDAAEQRLRAAGLSYVRRSQLGIQTALQLPGVVLLDSMGELASLFPLADVVFMGGTLARRGGHNLLEPAACGKAIIAGPHLENFAEMAEEFRRAGALLEIQDSRELARAVERLIDDAHLRRNLGLRAAEVAEKRRGVTAKTADEIFKWYDLAVPANRASGPAVPLLWLVSRIWARISSWNIHRNMVRARRLNTPVISIGGIGMGGAGKTPMVEYLAGRLRDTGCQPAILTRGYRRHSILRSVIIEAGYPAPVDLTGDEAQIFVRAGVAHVGIGADRWRTGQLLETKLQPDIFLLDDGFQHRRLARDLDIVLIDALNPLAGGAVFPLGYLREPWSALSRADAFVIMRAAPGREYRGLRDRLRAENPSAPIFRALVEPRYWINYCTGQHLAAPDRPYTAFCGLANPASFWITLKTLGISPAFRWTFGDHHHYSYREMQRLVAHASSNDISALLTTEKDAMNLPGETAELLSNASVDLYWLKIGVRVLEEAELLGLIESKRRKLAPR